LFAVICAVVPSYNKDDVTLRVQMLSQRCWSRSDWRQEMWRLVHHWQDDRPRSRHKLAMARLSNLS